MAETPVAAEALNPSGACGGHWGCEGRKRAGPVCPDSGLDPFIVQCHLDPMWGTQAQPCLSLAGEWMLSTWYTGVSACSRG